MATVPTREYVESLISKIVGDKKHYIFRGMTTNYNDYIVMYRDYTKEGAPPAKFTFRAGLGDVKKDANGRKILKDGAIIFDPHFLHWEQEAKDIFEPVVKKLETLIKTKKT